MVLNKEIRNCKKHGNVLHGIYEYDGYVRITCLICTREKQLNRRKDPEKKKHDLEYTREWSKIRKEHLNEISRKKRIIAKQKRKDLVDTVLSENLMKINSFLKKINSSYTISDLSKWGSRFKKTPSLDKIINHIKSKRISELHDKEAYKQSSLVKFHHGVRGSYKFLREQDKQEIRKIYKEKAKNIVNEKIIHEIWT